VPYASVTTRMPANTNKMAGLVKGGTNAAASTNATVSAAGTNAAAATNVTAKSDRKSKENMKPIEVVFVVDGDHVKQMPVKIGVSDDAYWEIAEGLKEGDEVVSGGHKAIGRDLEDGKKIQKGGPDMAGMKKPE